MRKDMEIHYDLENQLQKGTVTIEQVEKILKSVTEPYELNEYVISMMLNYKSELLGKNLLKIVNHMLLSLGRSEMRDYTTLDESLVKSLVILYKDEFIS